jgi:1,2-diacylglycerol-3-alpha-glucose alpha-1,2-galactosyltransferase
MRVHVVSELSWLLKGNGVNTVFVQHVQMLRELPGIQVVVNGHGTGDVFHSHSYGLGYFLRGLRYKGRRVLTVHVIPDSARGSIPGWQVLMPLLKWYFRMVYDYADVCIALSPTVEKAIRDTGSKTRIVRVGNAIPIEFWERNEERRRKGREMLGLQDSDFVVLGVGQLEGRKGVEDFLDIAEQVPEARFVWAGGRPFGALTEGLIRINARLARLPEHITFPGMFELSEMPAVYAAADAFIFPSYQENCPMAPLEAAAAGLPVVFRNLPEYQLLYENPWLSAADNEEFITLIKKLMSDKEFYKAQVAVSQRLLQQFDKGKICERMIGIYTELCQNR